MLLRRPKKRPQSSEMTRLFSDQLSPANRHINTIDHASKHEARICGASVSVALQMCMQLHVQVNRVWTCIGILGPKTSKVQSQSQCESVGCGGCGCGFWFVVQSRSGVDVGDVK